MYNLWEHKKLMKERLKYLVCKDLDLLNENNRAIVNYNEIEKEFRIMVNLLIRCVIKKDYSDYDEIIGMLENAIQKEGIAIEALLNELQQGG